MKRSVCEKEEKQKNGFPANRKTVFFLFHLNLAGREKTAPIMKQKATNPIAATSPSKIERNAEGFFRNPYCQGYEDTYRNTADNSFQQFFAFEVSVVFPFVMPESKSCRHDYKRDTESISDNFHNMFNLIF